jgi:hypothetical protein
MRRLSAIEYNEIGVPRTEHWLAPEMVESLRARGLIRIWEDARGEARFELTELGHLAYRVYELTLDFEWLYLERGPE